MRGVRSKTVHVMHDGKFVKGQICRHCKFAKPLDDFYIYHTAGRYSTLCKPCERAKYRDYHARNREVENAKSCAYHKERRAKKRAEKALQKV